MATSNRAAIIFFIFIYSVAGFAQNELDPFKYIIVPKQYDFLKRENQYRVNSMTKFLFEQEGYTVFYQGDEYPEDLNANPCLAATAFVINKSNAFTTKVVISLEDCRDNEVYRTAEGRSKIKEFDKTYADAIKKSFVSIENLNYSYDPSKVINGGINTMVVAEQSNKEIKSSDVPKTEEKQNQQSTGSVSVDKNSSAVGATTVTAVPIVVADKPQEEPVQEVAEQNSTIPEEKTETSNSIGGARAFKNENTSFLLIDQGAQMQAFVSESKNKDYKPGELIGTFKKTSLPNVFRVSWKKPLEGVESTTAYFDDKGNLKIDIERNGKIDVITFKEVK